LKFKILSSLPKMSYTLTYRFYLDPNYFLLSGLPLIIRIIFMFVVNYYILRASRNQPDGIRRTNYLKWCAIINFIFTLFPLILPELVIITPTLPLQDLSFISFYYILTGIILTVPFLISYGVLLFLFARQNRDNLGSYLYAAGICFLVGYSFYSISLGGNVIPIFLNLDIFPFVWTIPITILSLGASLISLVGFIFFIIHGVNKRDFNFKMAGILYFVGFGISFIFSFFVSYFIIFSHFFP